MLLYGFVQVPAFMGAQDSPQVGGGRRVCVGGGAAAAAGREGRQQPRHPTCTHAHRPPGRAPRHPRRPRSRAPSRAACVRSGIACTALHSPSCRSAGSRPRARSGCACTWSRWGARGAGEGRRGREGGCMRPRSAHRRACSTAAGCARCSEIHAPRHAPHPTLPTCPPARPPGACGAHGGVAEPGRPRGPVGARQQARARAASQLVPLRAAPRRAALPLTPCAHLPQTTPPVPPHPPPPVQFHAALPVCRV